MKAYLDADILIYRIGFTTQEEDLEIAKWRMNELIQKILADVKATSYHCYLTTSGDSTAFRDKVYPEYKQNRKAPKPVHYQALREFLIEEYPTTLVSVIEADDALSIAQYESLSKGEDSIICSIDKDLDMVMGWHYNFVKEIKYYIHEEQAIYNFYRQLLMGDRADNVKGVEGIGEKKADKILSGSEDEQELFERVRSTYNNDEEMLRTGEVLWILRDLEKPWSLTKYGSVLMQEMGFHSLSDLKPIPVGTESIGEEMSMDGFLQNGTDHQEVFTEMDENPH